MIERGRPRIVVQDLNGVASLQCGLPKRRAVKKALLELGLPDEENARILALYEEVFDHQSFTGRSARSTSMRAWLHLLAHGFQAPFWQFRRCLTTPWRGRGRRRHRRIITTTTKFARHRVHKSPSCMARSPLILIPTRPDLREYSSLA